jgi:hypothetical protein
MSTMLKNFFFLTCCLFSLSTQPSEDEGFKKNRKKLCQLLKKYKEEDPVSKRSAVAKEIIAWADESNNKGYEVSITHYTSKPGLPGDSCWGIGFKGLPLRDRYFYNSSLASILLEKRRERFPMVLLNDLFNEPWLIKLLVLEFYDDEYGDLMFVDEIRDEWLSRYQQSYGSMSGYPNSIRTFDWFVMQKKNEEAMAGAEEGTQCCCLMQ